MIVFRAGIQGCLSLSIRDVCFYLPGMFVFYLPGMFIFIYQGCLFLSTRDVYFLSIRDVYFYLSGMFICIYQGCLFLSIRDVYYLNYLKRYCNPEKIHNYPGEVHVADHHYVEVSEELQLF